MIFTKEQNIKIIKINTKKEDSIFLVTSILILSFVSFLLYSDIYKTYRGTGEPIGKIVFKKKVALRKYQNQSIWEYLQNEYPIYNGDSIKTEELSEAVLELKDGTKISINESSYIVINLLGEETKIDFNYGSLETNTESSNVKIQTKDSEILLTSANAKLVNQNESLQIQLNKGEANLKSKGKEEKIKENEVVLLNKESNELQKEKIPLKLISPEDNSIFFIDTSTIYINFVIEGDSSQNYLLLISNSPNFNKIVVRSEIKNQTQINLTSGTYFWKVISKESNTQINFYRKFTILQKEKIQLQLPKDKNIFQFKENQNINFSWSQSENANSYEIWIDTNPNFTNPQKISTLVNFLSIPFELKDPIKEYFWKVVPITAQKDSVLESETFSFTIQKLEKDPPAKLITPIKQTFFLYDLQKGILFNWKIQNPKNQTLQISKDKNFQQIVIQEKLSNTYFLLKSSLEPGVYYWRVLNQDNVESDIESFTINDKMDIQILQPKKNQIFILPKQQNIFFSWQFFEESFTYRFVLSLDPNFKNILHTAVLNNSNYSLNLDKVAKNNEGILYWKIFVLSKDQTRIFAESSSSFQVYYQPEQPKWIQPNQNQIYDVSKINTILFQWTKTKFTDYYEFEIYKNNFLVDKLVLKNHFIDYNPFKKLSLGKFQCKVRSIREIESEILKSEEIEIDFILEQKLIKKPEFLTPKKIFID